MRALRIAAYSRVSSLELGARKMRVHQNRFNVRFFAFYTLRPRSRTCCRRLHAQKSRPPQMQSRQNLAHFPSKPGRCEQPTRTSRRSAACPDGLGTTLYDPLARADQAEAANRRPEHPGLVVALPRLGPTRTHPRASRCERHARRWQAPGGARRGPAVGSGSPVVGAAGWAALHGSAEQPCACERGHTQALDCYCFCFGLR